ncbi:MAG: rhomboid family intramembrane serine protease [Chitinophagaceae bacterium]|nr:rhomboid family intramembrane serine protease [Chitinophagaceae bacterium]
MTETGIAGLLLIIANFVISYTGFINEHFFDRYKFEVDKILISKDYKRLISSGFLHVGWTHLIFNMFSLFAFSVLIEANLGELKFLIIYFVSLIGGNLLSLFVHRHHGDYSSVGASGPICGIIFACIALFPGMGISFFGLAFSIPSWLYGIVYVLYSIYGIKSKKDNIGHEAHLGGALLGMTAALIMEPSAFLENYFTILIIAIPTIIFIYIIITRPQVLLVDNYFFNTHKNYYSPDHQYNAERNELQREMDRILDKISMYGMESLSRKEKEKLKEYSHKIR